MKPILPDFKSERSDVLPPLPGILRLVPIGFYFSLVGLAAMAAYSFYGERSLQTETTAMRQNQAVEQGRIYALTQQELGLSSEVKQAREVQAWITGNTELYPMILKIARTVDPDTSISELNLSRMEEKPSHVKMVVKLHSPRGAEQAEILTQAIADTLNLRPYSSSTTPSEGTDEVQLECYWAPTVALNDDGR